MNAPFVPVPGYPLRYTYREAQAWTIAGLTETPPLPTAATETGAKVSAVDLGIRRIVDTYVRDRAHREQLKAWARAASSPRDRDQAFAATCRERGWNRGTAIRNVEKALAMVMVILNTREDRFFGSGNVSAKNP